MSFLDSVFGAKPQIADYESIDFSAEQLKALEGDLAAWPDIQSLGNLFQTYLLQGYERAIPGFGDILKLGGQTTKDMLSKADEYLHGNIPQDVQDAVQRSSAFQNLLSGGGGGMAQANTARQFGLTSMNLIEQGAQLAGQAGNAAQQWANISGAGGAANLMAGMLVTPQQQAQLDMQQNLIKQAVQQAKYNVAAAPNPGLQALNQWIEQVGGTILSAYATGGMSKGGDFKTGYNAQQYLGGGGPSDVSNPGYSMGSSPAPGYGAAPFGGGGYQPIGGYGAGSPGSFNDQFALPAGGGTGDTSFIDNLNSQAFYQGAFGGMGW